MTSRLLKIIVDDSKFYLSLNNLKKYQQSLLFKVLSEQKIDQRVVYSDGYFYIDADKDSFLWIVSYLRGYPIDIKNLPAETKSKIYFDAQYFQLTDICNMFDDKGKNNKNNNTVKHENESVNILDRCSENSEDPTSSEIDFNNTKLEDILKLNDDEKELFDKEMEEEEHKLQLQRSKRPEPKKMDTSVLLTNNKTKIDELISTIQEKLSGDDVSTVIHTLSNDKNICDAVKKFNKKKYELFDDDDEDMKQENKENAKDADKEYEEQDDDDDKMANVYKLSKVKTKYVKI